MIFKKEIIFFGLLFVLNCLSMDIPFVSSKKNNIVFLTLSDGASTTLERWKIDQIKTLLVIFEQQKGSNSAKQPLIATMLTLPELTILSDALNAMVKGKFEVFLNKMVELEGTTFLNMQEKEALESGSALLKRLQINASLRQGGLRNLINLAERMNVSVLSALCLQYTLPADMQNKQLVFDMVSSIKQLIPCNTQILSGHANDVEQVILSPNGIQFISGSNSIKNNLILWDISTGYAKELKNLNGHPSYITAAAFSPNGEMIVSSCLGGENNLILWDVKSGKGHPLKGHSDSVTTVAFSSDGKYIASGSKGERDNLIIWDVVQKKQLKSLEGHPIAVRCIAFSPDNTKLVSGCLYEDNNLLLWDIESGKSTPLIGHPDSVTHVRFSHNGQKIIAGGFGNRNDKLVLWDVKTLKGTVLNIGHDSNIQDVSFSPNDEMVMVAAWGGFNNLILWDTLTLQQRYNFSGYSRGVRNALFNKDGNFIISCGENATSSDVILYELDTKASHTLLTSSDSVNRVAISFDGRKIIVGCNGQENNLIMLSLLSAEEEEALKKCTFIQTYFLYRLFLTASYGLEIDIKSEVEKTIYKSLPKILKDMINERIVSNKAVKKNMFDWIPHPSLGKKKK